MSEFVKFDSQALFYMIRKSELYIKTSKKTWNVFGQCADFFRNHFVCLSSMFLGVIYVSQMVVFYPGLPNGDNIGQLAQAFGVENYNNHHPVLHTWFLGLCMRIGRIIYNDNLGLFMYVIAQNLFLLAVAVYALHYLLEKGLRIRYIVLLLLYYGLHPILLNYSLCIIKDTWYTGFLTLLLVLTHRYVINNGGRKNLSGIIICMLFMMLLRNDGIYMSILFCGMMILSKNRNLRIAFCKVFVELILIFVVWHSLILPAMSVKEGSRREMLSLPFQQTARYVKEYPSEVTEEEKSSINAILQYDQLAERYDPVNADPVKITFKEQSSSADIRAYLKSWMGMLIKHPATCFQATWDNKDEFFLPKGAMSFSSVSDAEMIMQRIEREVSGGNIHLFFKSDVRLREYLEKMRAFLGKYTVFLFLRIPCLYIWGMCVWSIYSLVRRDHVSFILCIPFLINLLINIAGPMNGSYTRYMYLYMYALPIAIALGNLMGDQNALNIKK